MRAIARESDVHGCARCGGDHKLVFQPFERPVVIAAPVEFGRPSQPDQVLTHWATCPTNDEPILMAVKE